MFHKPLAQGANLTYHLLMTSMSSRVPKHRKVHGALEQQIRSGRLGPGDRLPSEAELVRQFGASRITVGRAVRDLQLAGLVERKAGSGTYVKAIEPRPGALSFGLLIPDLGETEIFEPICQGMMASPLAREHALVWGSLSGKASSKEERAWDLCRQYVDRKVSGVFFAPLELTPTKDEVNARIAQALDDASVPVVLLDRTVGPYPSAATTTSWPSTIGRRATPSPSIYSPWAPAASSFVGLPHAAATVDARAAGYREALHAWGVPCSSSPVHRLDPADAQSVRALMEVRGPRASWRPMTGRRPG